jgi:hypothetical protein
MKSFRVLAPTLLGAVLIAALPFGASAGPVCHDIPQEACGGRIFAEPEQSLTFVQHDNGEYEGGIKALEQQFPRWVKVRTFAQKLDKEVKSAGGREIWMIEITDFDAPEKNKIPVTVSLSAHGPERAGLEGGVRYAEDLARWAESDPDRTLRNGTEKDSVEIPIRDALKKTHIYLANINPDGWAQGDIQNGGLFQRGNENGVDLNREFPTKGWTKVSYTPMSEPESKAWVQLVRSIDPVVASDLHGELTSVNNAFADIMYPAGQWDPRELAQEERLARHMASNVARYFDEEGVVIADVTGNAEMKPADYATAYDVVGYDDSGFMGDFFTEQIGAVEVDVEHFLSHQAPNSTWIPLLEQAHVAAVRGEIETLIVEALVTKKTDVSLALGKVGYLFDPRVATNKDGYGGPPPPDGYTPRPYRATRMKYFKDLSRYTTKPLRKLTGMEIIKGGLKGLDSFVISNRPSPWNEEGRVRHKNAYVTALRRFVRHGGNLILTDRALKLLPRLKVVAKDAVRQDLYNAGHVDIEDFEDPYTKKLTDTASQTYYEVPLGYSVDEDSSPHWTVARDAWEGAGGESVAYITDESRIGLGRIEKGRGTIGIIGALLPKQTEKFDHLYGLADYAVTVTGGQILYNMLKFGR